MYLYRVFLVYGGDRKDPKIFYPSSSLVVAKDEDDAKVKSEVYKQIDPSWDSEYVNIIVEKIAEVRVKAKPQEVKQV